MAKKRKKKAAVAQPAYPRVAVRVSQDEEVSPVALVDGFMRGVSTIAAKFPFEIYDIMDSLTLTDPYVSKFHYTTVALGNTGHNIEINASSERRANQAIQVCNDLAARCFPLAGGTYGLVTALLSQAARTGGMCSEWVPDKALTRIDRAYMVPVKTIKFRYDAKGDVELCQQQKMDLVRLNSIQTVFHNTQTRDTNPYPVPPAIAALESCATHKKIIDKIGLWMEKVSALGVLLATSTPPPRGIGEPEDVYNAKAKEYLTQLADTLAKNMASGLGVAYDNVTFQFQNTQAGAAGAKDILQMVLQGLFSALNRDPVMFGWNWNSTESYARVVYEEMVSALRAFQLGAERVLEHGYRLNLALQGYGDVGLNVSFNSARSIDQFRDSEAAYMDAQKILAEVEGGLLTPEEGRRLLGHDEKKATAGEYVANFSRDDNRYVMLKPLKKTWNIQYWTEQHERSGANDHFRNLTLKLIEGHRQNEEKSVPATPENSVGEQPEQNG